MKLVLPPPPIPSVEPSPWMELIGSVRSEDSRKETSQVLKVCGKANGSESRRATVWRSWSVRGR
jgi:hypothetical protein